jgi:SPP1 family phage portal protein
VLGLVDLYDRVISQDVANELSRFANAYLMLADTIDDVTVDERGRTKLDRLKEVKIFDQLGIDGDVRQKVAYLERNVNNSFIEATLDRAERLIYEMLNMQNPNDDGFAAASGIAQKWKMLGAELDAANMESYFSIFLYQRIELIAAILSNTGSPVSGDVESVDISFKRTTPSNLLEIAQTIALFGGQELSERTKLGLLPSDVIESVDDELERLAEQRLANPENMAMDAAAMPEQPEPMDTPEAVASGDMNSLPDSVPSNAQGVRAINGAE